MAQKQHKGTVFSAWPEVQNHRPVLVVLVADQGKVNDHHFLWDSPRVMFMHIGGMGEEATLARAVGRVFGKLKEVIRTPPSPPTAKSTETTRCWRVSCRTCSGPCVAQTSISWRSTTT